MLQAILFDLDGTLVDTDTVHFNAWYTIWHDDLNFEISRDFYDRHISGRTNEEIVKDLLADLPFEEGMKLADIKEALFRESRDQLVPLPGLLSLLEWIDERELPTAVVTNAPRANAELLLQTIALSDRFSTVVLAEDAIAGKPEPAPYQLALERLGIAPNAAIAFEDSPTGVRAAVAAGIETIGIASTHNPQHLQIAGAIAVIEDFTDPVLWKRLQERWEN